MGAGDRRSAEGAEVRVGGPHGSEMERLELLERVLGSTRDARVLMGIGDDGAVLVPGSEPLVWSVDVLVEGVHFQREWLSLHDLGYRSTMAAASDLAAMAALPRGVLTSVILPSSATDEELEQLARGLSEACGELDTQVVGGNLSRGDVLSVTTTVLGSAPEPVGRAGAVAGDAILLAGPVGLAAAGLEHLRRAASADDGPPAVAGAIGAWRRPKARLAEGQRVRGLARAAIDVSDGLALDLTRIVRASRRAPGAAPVRMVIEQDAIVSEQLRQAAEGLDCSALELAWGGGEDYALVVIAPVSEPPKGFVRIGQCAAALNDGPLVELRDADGHPQPMPTLGYDHFR